MYRIKYVLPIVLCFFSITTAHAVNIASDLTARCSDGKERMIVYTQDGIFDITESNDATSVAPNMKMFKQLCSVNDQLVIAHCHTTDDILSSFPSGNYDVLSSGDISVMAMMDQQCYEKNLAVPSVRTQATHLLYNLSENTVVTYKLATTVKEKLDEITLGIHMILGTIHRTKEARIRNLLLERAGLIREYLSRLKKVNSLYVYRQAEYLESKQCTKSVDSETDKAVLSDGCGRVSIQDFVEYLKQQDAFFVLQVYKIGELEVIINE